MKCHVICEKFFSAQPKGAPSRLVTAVCAVEFLDTRLTDVTILQFWELSPGVTMVLLLVET
jgi:hypothetical protein